MSQPTNIQVSFQIVDCKCTEFTITEFGKSNKTALPTGQAQYVVTIGFKVLEQKKSVSVELSTIVLDNAQNKNEVFKIKSSHEFKFVDTTNIFIKNGNQVAVPNVILTTIYSVALSNHRGMNAVKLENTIYNNIVFPIIDASQFIPKPPANFG